MDVTHNFTPGTRAVAEQVNQNFADVKSAIDPLQTDVADIKTQLTSGIVLPDGSVDFTRLQSYKTYTVSNATNATPIVITAVGHGFLTGDKVYISGVGGNTAANGTFTITKLGADTFSLDGSVGNGTFTTNGSAIIYPSADKNLVNKAYVTETIKNINPTLSTSDMPVLANNNSDANNAIDFSAGFCYDLTTNIKITNTALTKRLDATFVAGTNQGGLDTGTKAINTWYHCFAISKADGTADFLFSTSATAPTMPSGFINKRRIGSPVQTDANGNIKGFYQHGDLIQYNNSIQDVNSSITTTATLYKLSVPTGLCVLPICNYILEDNYGGVYNAYILISSPLQIDTVPSATNYNIFTSRANNTFNNSGSTSQLFLTNTDGQIRGRSNIFLNGFRIQTSGYIDKRGAN